MSKMKKEIEARTKKLKAEFERLNKKSIERLREQMGDFHERFNPNSPDHVETLEQLGVYLRRNGITPRTAWGILWRHFEEGDTRKNYKMMRFTQYLWERHREYKANKIGKKIDTIRKVVSTDTFKLIFQGYFPDLKFDKEKEITKLNQLIADPRQQKYFAEGLYKIEKTSKDMPQKLINELIR